MQDFWNTPKFFFSCMFLNPNYFFRIWIVSKIDLTFHFSSKMFYWSQNVYKKFSRSLEQFFSHRRTEQFWKQNTSTPPEYIFCFFLSVSMILKILLLLIRITTLEYTCFLQARQANVHTSYYMCRTVATANTYFSHCFLFSEICFLLWRNRSGKLHKKFFWGMNPLPKGLFVNVYILFTGKGNINNMYIALAQ